MGELEAALDAIGHSDARVVLPRADGPDFSFGADITSWDYSDLRALRTEFALNLAVANRFERFPLPVITAVQGRCLGGGFELVPRADVICAADSARFATPSRRRESSRYSAGSTGSPSAPGHLALPNGRSPRSRSRHWSWPPLAW